MKKLIYAHCSFFILLFLFCCHNSFGQSVPVVTDFLPSQIGENGIKLDSINNKRYFYDEKCRLINYCYESQNGTRCIDISYIDNKISRIDYIHSTSYGSHREFEYDMKCRIIKMKEIFSGVTSGSVSRYNVSYDDKDRLVFISKKANWSGGTGSG